jgi:hypothetical protein
MKHSIILLVVVLSLAVAAAAQEIKFPPGLNNLAAKAKETVDVTLDGQMLQLASGYLSDKNSDEAETRKVVEGLKGIYVKSFEFDKPGQYSMADVESVRSQLQAPTWSRVVNVRDGNELTEVYFKSENGQISGLMLIAAEPQELTLVHIVGPIRPDQLKALSGHFGIPNTGGTEHKSQAPTTPKAKEPGK